MRFYLTAILTIISISFGASANEGKLRCFLEAFKVKSPESFLTSKLTKELKAEKPESNPNLLLLGTDVAYASDKSVFLYVSLNTKTGDLQADLRNSGNPPMADGFGAGVGRFKGKIQLENQTFIVSSIFPGTIEKGFLDDREDENLVEFDSLTLNCTYEK